MSSKTDSGVGRCGYSTLCAPTPIGKKQALPRPYAKKSFAAE